MAETTNITFADATWNPWIGCFKISAGCVNCYAERDNKNRGYDFSIVRRASPASFNAPLKWAKNGKVKEGARIFTPSWSDPFINEADPWRVEWWEIIKNTPFTYMIFTKRENRIEKCLPPDWGKGYPNVWLFVTAENNELLQKRWPVLAKIPAVLKGISLEPCLGSYDFGELMVKVYNYEAYAVPEWLILGGESGPNYRAMKHEWARDVQVWAHDWGIPYFFKQWGGIVKGHGGVWGGDELEGVVYHEIPTVRTEI